MIAMNAEAISIVSSKLCHRTPKSAILQSKLGRAEYRAMLFLRSEHYRTVLPQSICLSEAGVIESGTEALRRK